MSICPFIEDTVQALKYDFRRIRRDVSIINLFIFDLYLNYICKNGIGVKTNEFKIYRHLEESLKNDNQVATLDDIKIVLNSAAEYYKKPALSSVPLMFNNNSILEVLSSKRLNELSSYLIDIDRKDSKEEYDRYINNILYIFRELALLNSIKSLTIFDKQILKIITSILDVQDTDIFMDIVSGYGLSTLEIVGVSKAKVELFEVANDIALFSEMLFIVCEKEKYSILAKDTLFSDNIEKSCADKIFLDPPIRHMAENEKVSFNGICLRDSSVSSVLRAANALNDKGVAIVAVPPSFLFGISFGADAARAYLLDNKLLEAVITLPPCWHHSSIATNLLIISKKDNEEVTFIDLKNDAKFVRHNVLTDKGVSFILDSLAGRNEESVFFCKKPIENVNSGTFAPIAYLNIDKIEYSKEFVSKQLNELYDKLKNILD